MVLPTRGSDRAELRLSFSNLVFANGYAEACEGSATFSVVVSRNSDVLLDQGTQVEFILVRDLVLLEPLPGVKRMPVETFKSATRCVPTPATPGIQPTIIPGSTGSPDQVVGTPGTPEIPCPAPPSVSSELVKHSETFDAHQDFRVASATLPKGHYAVTWTGLGPVTDLQFHGRTVTSVQVRILGIEAAASRTTLGTKKDARSGLPFTTLQFKGKALELQFE